MKSRYLFFLFISFAISSCNGQQSKNIKNIPAEDFANQINKTPKAQILDVRTPEEFDVEHIDNSININWLGDSFLEGTKNLDKSKPVFVYCKSGARSAKASEKLQELGFTTIYQLEGGFLKWNAAGMSTRAEGEQGEAKPSDKIIGMRSQEYAELLNTDKKVLIDFYAEWCAPCKKMTPYIIKMQKDLADKVLIIRLNADENPTLMKEMKISELPTLLIYKNKELKWKNSGYISEEDLKKQLL